MDRALEASLHLRVEGARRARTPEEGSEDTLRAGPGIEGTRLGHTIRYLLQGALPGSTDNVLVCESLQPYCPEWGQALDAASNFSWRVFTQIRMSGAHSFVARRCIFVCTALFSTTSFLTNNRCRDSCTDLSWEELRWTHLYDGAAWPALRSRGCGPGNPGEKRRHTC